MDPQTCKSFPNENSLCYLATTDDDQPHVRALLMWFADDNGFYFGTLSPKNISKQLHKNPKVEVCFFKSRENIMEAKMMRITGKAEFIYDPKMLDKMYEDRKFLEEIYGKPIKSFMEVFRIPTGEAHFWMMKDILREPELERLSF